MGDKCAQNRDDIPGLKRGQGREKGAALSSFALVSQLMEKNVLITVIALPEPEEKIDLLQVLRLKTERQRKGLMRSEADS